MDLLLFILAIIIVGLVILIIDKKEANADGELGLADKAGIGAQVQKVADKVDEIKKDL